MKMTNSPSSMARCHICPVCGYPELTEPAYRESGRSITGSFEICPSCGFQFAVTDHDKHITHEQWREKWINDGMVWDKGRTSPPEDWDPRQQLLNIGITT